MVGKVVQFIESHKWRGCLGIVEEARETVTAYIFAQREDFEIIGDAVLIERDE